MCRMSHWHEAAAVAVTEGEAVMEGAVIAVDTVAAIAEVIATAAADTMAAIPAADTPTVAPILAARLATPWAVPVLRAERAPGARYPVIIMDRSSPVTPSEGSESTPVSKKYAITSHTVCAKPFFFDDSSIHLL